MSKNINPIRKLKLKQELLNPNTKSIKQAVINAGYSPNSAINAHRLSVVKCCLQEIEREMHDKVTVEEIVKQLQSTRLLAIEKRDYATAAFCSTQLGKHLAMFIDNSKQEITNKPSVEQDADIIERLRLSRLARVDVPSMG